MSQTYQIPKSYLPGFKYLSEIGDDEIQNIAHFISNQPIGTGIKTFVESFSQHFDKDWSKPIANAIYSFGFLKASNDDKVTDIDIVRALTEAFGRQAEEDTVDPSVTDRLIHNLEAIFAVLEPLRMSHKIFGLLSENNRTFVDARIITDIRPIFSSDLKFDQRSALLVHRLKIASQENGDEKEYYFSFDSNDLKKLKLQIERAEEKDEILRQQYAQTFDFISISE